MKKKEIFEQKELDRVLAILQQHIGKDNPIKSRYLHSQPITARKMIHSLRMQGHPICSGRNGYFMASNSRELGETIAYIRAIAEEQLRTIEELTDCYNTLLWAETLDKEDN